MQIKLVDLDLYRAGPFVNDVGRMFGSTRFMAPEEFVQRAQIDEETTVFTMGRCIRVFLADPSAQNDSGALDALLSIAERACREERLARWSSMNEFLAEWQRTAALATARASNSDDELDNHAPSLRSVACLRVIASR